MELSSAPIDVIIVNWNGCHLLGPCLAALRAGTGIDYRVLVYDNGSHDGSTAYLAEQHPDVTVLAGDRNIGFSPAVNAAIHAGRSRYVVLLNNDTEVDPDWLMTLYATAEAHPEAGMVASQMVFASAPDRINSAGISLDRCGIAWDRHGGQPARADGGLEDIFGPSGGAALYRRSMLDAIGLFDGDFFAYLEDVDLAWRAQLAGWRCLYNPAARVRHRHSATGGEGSPLKNYLLSRNKVWTVIKNYPAPEILRYLPAIYFYDVGTAPYRLVLKGDLHSLRGRAAAVTALPRFLEKRRGVQRLMTPAGREHAWRLMQPVASPWAVLDRYRHLARVTTG